MDTKTHLWDPDARAWVPPLAPPLDDDVQAFLAAADIDDPTVEEAISTLVATLKADGIWDKLHAFWPLVGGNAFAHKFNLIDPRDDDAAYRLTFAGTWAHSSSGATSDGSTAYADTHFAPADRLTVSSGGGGLYPGTAGAQGMAYDFAVDDGDVHAFAVITHYGSGNAYCCYGDPASMFQPNLSSPDARGFWAVNRKSLTTTQAVHNGLVVATAAQDPILPASGRTVFLGANNKSGTAVYFAARSYRAVWVNDGLTADELADFYAAVQTFQTALGRQV